MIVVLPEPPGPVTMFSPGLNSSLRRRQTPTWRSSRRLMAGQIEIPLFIFILYDLRGLGRDNALFFCLRIDKNLFGGFNAAVD